MTKWTPIETIEKEGRHEVKYLCWDGTRFAIMTYYGGRCFVNEEGVRTHMRVTHVTNLPDPPK